jgi:hypothetical protein
LETGSRGEGRFGEGCVGVVMEMVRPPSLFGASLNVALWAILIVSARPSPRPGLAWPGLAGTVRKRVELVWPDTLI